MRYQQEESVSSRIKRIENLSYHGEYDEIIDIFSNQKKSDQKTTLRRISHSAYQGLVKSDAEIADTILHNHTDVIQNSGVRPPIRKAVNDLIKNGADPDPGTVGALIDTVGRDVFAESIKGFTDQELATAILYAMANKANVETIYSLYNQIEEPPVRGRRPYKNSYPERFQSNITPYSGAVLFGYNELLDELKPDKHKHRLSNLFAKAAGVENKKAIKKLAGYANKNDIKELVELSCDNGRWEAIFETLFEALPDRKTSGLGSLLRRSIRLLVQKEDANSFDVGKRIQTLVGLLDKYAPQAMTADYLKRYIRQYGADGVSDTINGGADLPKRPVQGLIEAYAKGARGHDDRFTTRHRFGAMVCEALENRNVQPAPIQKPGDLIDAARGGAEQMIQDIAKRSGLDFNPNQYPEALNRVVEQTKNDLDGLLDLWDPTQVQVDTNRLQYLARKGRIDAIETLMERGFVKQKQVDQTWSAANSEHQHELMQIGAHMPASISGEKRLEFMDSARKGQNYQATHTFGESEDYYGEQSTDQYRRRFEEQFFARGLETAAYNGEYDKLDKLLSDNTYTEDELARGVWACIANRPSRSPSVRSLETTRKILNRFREAGWDDPPIGGVVFPVRETDGCTVFDADAGTYDSVDGLTMLEYAASMGRTKLVYILTQDGTYNPLHEHNSGARRALQYSMQNSDYETARTLIEEISVQDLNGFYEQFIAMDGNESIYCALNEHLVNNYPIQLTKDHAHHLYNKMIVRDEDEQQFLDIVDPFVQAQKVPDKLAIMNDLGQGHAPPTAVLNSLYRDYGFPAPDALDSLVWFENLPDKPDRYKLENGSIDKHSDAIDQLKMATDLFLDFFEDRPELQERLVDEHPQTVAYFAFESGREDHLFEVLEQNSLQSTWEPILKRYFNIDYRLADIKKFVNKQSDEQKVYQFSGAGDSTVASWFCQIVSKFDRYPDGELGDTLADFLKEHDEYSKEVQSKNAAATI